MSRMTLSQLEDSVNQLDLADQLRLVQSLLPRVTGAILASVPTGPAANADEAVRRILAAGDRLSEQSPPGSTSIVDELTRSRR